MKYTVCWKPFVEDQLAEIWLQATDRAAVSDASSELDRLLGYQPETLGESRSDRTRVLVVPPLIVSFEFSPADNLVTVLSLRYLPPRK